MEAVSKADYDAQRQRARVHYELALNKSLVLTPKIMAQFMAYAWGKGHPASRYEERGKNFVCKDVVVSACELARRHSAFEAPDWWATNVENVFHTTPSFYFPQLGDWYAFEVAMENGQYVGYYRKFRRRHTNPLFPQSVVLTARRDEVDINWYRHIQGGRHLTGWVGKVPDFLYRQWQRVMYDTHIIQAHEVLTGEARELCDDPSDPNDRHVAV